MDDVRVHTGTLIADLVLPSSGSLKDRRGPQRALVQRLRNANFSVAQVGPTDFLQRWFLAVTAVSGSPTQLNELLDSVERTIFATEFEVADLRRIISSETYPSSC